MARSQTWTRNISKQSKKSALLRPIVEDDALGGFKRRVEDLGLIIHARSDRPPKPKRASKKGGKK
jgi:hypothetical protein